MNATRASRVFYTLVAPLVVLLLGRIPLPGVDLTTLPEADFMRLENLSLGALGIMPFITAAVLVELVALALPALRPLRDEVEGRRRLGRAALALSLALAVFQAWGIATLIDTVVAGMGPSLRLTLTLTAGFCVTLATAQLVSARGAMNGVVAVWGSSWAIGAAHDLAAFWAEDVAGVITPLHATLSWVLSVGCIAGVTAVVVLATHRRQAPQPILPGPACGVVAMVQAVNASMLPSTVAVTLDLDAPTLWTPTDIELAIIGVGSALILTYLFVRPDRLTETWGLEGDALGKLVGPALATAVLFTLFLLFAPSALLNPGVAIRGTMVAILTAAAIDASRRLRAPRGLVPVRMFHRTHDAEAARARLVAADIIPHVDDAATRSMFHFFGPYVPIGVCVDPADREAAEEVLDAAEPLEPATGRRPWAPLLACMLGFVLLWGGERGLDAALALPPPPPSPPVELRLMAVADELPWMENLARASDVPAGVSFALENAPVGPGRTLPVTYAKVDGDQLPEAVTQWFAERVPAGHIVRWGRTYGEDASGTWIPEGWRSFVLHDEVLLDGADVRDAVADADHEPPFEPLWFVTVDLTPEGAARFAAATERLVRRRFAILIDGEVESAPEVREPIHGGSLRISMGKGSPKVQRQEAQRLADGLRRAR